MRDSMRFIHTRDNQNLTNTNDVFVLAIIFFKLEFSSIIMTQNKRKNRMWRICKVDLCYYYYYDSIVLTVLC
jgi:hypothetical protein